MTLSLSMSLSPNRRTLPQTSGPLAAEGWVLAPDGQDSFEILASQANGFAPPLSAPQSGLIRIGTATGWREPKTDARFSSTQRHWRT